MAQNSGRKFVSSFIEVALPDLAERSVSCCATTGVDVGLSRSAIISKAGSVGRESRDVAVDY